MDLPRSGQTDLPQFLPERRHSPSGTVLPARGRAGADHMPARRSARPLAPHRSRGRQLPPYGFPEFAWNHQPIAQLTAANPARIAARVASKTAVCVSIGAERPDHSAVAATAGERRPGDAAAAVLRATGAYFAGR